MPLSDGNALGDKYIYRERERDKQTHTYIHSFIHTFMNSYKYIHTYRQACMRTYTYYIDREGNQVGHRVTVSKAHWFTTCTQS